MGLGCDGDGWWRAPNRVLRLLLFREGAWGGGAAAARDGEGSGGPAVRQRRRQRSPKLVDMPASTHRVLMTFQFRERWTVHFLEADCKTALWERRYYDFGTVDQVRKILVLFRYAVHRNFL